MACGRIFWFYQCLSHIPLSSFKQTHQESFYWHRYAWTDNSCCTLKLITQIRGCDRSVAVPLNHLQGAAFIHMCWSALRVKQMITTLNCGSSSYWTHTHTHTWAMSERSAGVRLLRVRQGQITDWVRDRCEREEEKGSEHVKECSFSVHHFEAAPFPLLRTQWDMFIQQRLSFSHVSHRKPTIIVSYYTRIG